jgi:hypothetical protein
MTSQSVRIVTCLAVLAAGCGAPEVNEELSTWTSDGQGRPHATSTLEQRVDALAPPAPARDQVAETLAVTFPDFRVERPAGKARTWRLVAKSMGDHAVSMTFVDDAIWVINMSSNIAITHFVSGAETLDSRRLAAEATAALDSLRAAHH